MLEKAQDELAHQTHHRLFAVLQTGLAKARCFCQYNLCSDCVLCSLLDVTLVVLLQPLTSCEKSEQHVFLSETSVMCSTHVHICGGRFHDVVSGQYEHCLFWREPHCTGFAGASFRHCCRDSGSRFKESFKWLLTDLVIAAFALHSLVLRGLQKSSGSSARGSKSFVEEHWTQPKRVGHRLDQTLLWQLLYCRITFLLASPWNGEKKLFLLFIFQLMFFLISWNLLMNVKKMLHRLLLTAHWLKSVSSEMNTCFCKSFWGNCN